MVLDLQAIEDTRETRRQAVMCTEDSHPPGEHYDGTLFVEFSDAELSVSA
jgi:hypothetical protein